jgi:DNA invertase Pin-like site-specific DNA recombinase
MKPDLRVAIYARVSTANKGQDAGLQLRDLRAYAGSRGMTIFKRKFPLERGV